MITSNKFPPDLDILEWAKHWTGSHSAGKLPDDSNSTDILLTIGVKTAVVDNFARRQAIRDTWASKKILPANVRVFFVGCMPSMAKIPDARNRQRLHNAIALERAVYGDLLTEELECEDSHLLLADKVSAFLESFCRHCQAICIHSRAVDEAVVVKTPRQLSLQLPIIEALPSPEHRI